MTPSRRLKELVEGPGCKQLLEAHNALSATLVEAAGVAGIWASSLTLSCSYGLRDNSELTMTQVLDILESMTERVQVPILFDGDTGYGQFSHFQQLVRKLCARNVGGVCIEDKVFPKTNSFLNSEQQQLAPIEEFCGKLRAGKDAQPDPDFVIVARTEALVTGLDVSAALERAERYAEAGADAVLVHSKAKTFAPIEEFMGRWRGGAPVICVPTTYYSTPTQTFERAGISVVIWANHLLRAAVAAMQQVASHVGRTGSARDIEDLIVPVKELFRLQDTQALSESELVYGQSSELRAIVLAATRGDGLDELTRDRPKCMIPIGGVPAVEKQLQHLRAEGIRDISIVRGYKAEAISPEGVTFFDNPSWHETGELGSLGRARSELKGDVVVVYGDLIFKRYILHELLASDAPITLVVDGSHTSRRARRVDRVKVSAPPPSGYDESEFSLVEMGPQIRDDEADGEWIGLARAKGEGTELLRAVLDEVLSPPGGEQLDMCTLFNRLVERNELPVRVIYIQGGWIDINGLADIADENAS